MKTTPIKMTVKMTTKTVLNKPKEPKVVQDEKLKPKNDK